MSKPLSQISDKELQDLVVIARQTGADPSAALDEMGRRVARQMRIERAIKAAGPRVTKRERAFIEGLFS